MKEYQDRTEQEKEQDVSATEHEEGLNSDAVVETEDQPLPGDEKVEDEQVLEGESSQDAIRDGRRFVSPTRNQLITGIAFWGVILLGAILRFWGLGDKPLHHDESLHAYFSLQLMHQMENWAYCAKNAGQCYHYDPLLHGPFQFHAIALVYKICQLLGVYDNGVNTFTVRIPAATLGTVIVGLPYFFRDRLGTLGAWLACFLLAISPSMVYFSRFAREDIYMACFTLLLVVATARYLSTRRMRWIIWGAVAFALSYADKEATFLTVGVFGSFLGALLFWELGSFIRIPYNQTWNEVKWRRFLPDTAAPGVLLLYFAVMGLVAKWFFAWLKSLSIFITTNPTNTHIADIYVQGLKDKTLLLIPWIGIVLGLIVLGILVLEMMGILPLPGRGLASWTNSKRQPLLDTILSMPWTHWLFAILTAWAIFLVLFTVLFTYIGAGIADGIWQGLYYWIQQQQVARGEQPWYYYLLLIPLYEQIGLVFAVVGIVRALLRPTRFRLFLVYWFVGNFFIYSWAGEKMPWLMIHMTMPMMLLAALGLQPALATAIQFVREKMHRPAAVADEAQSMETLPSSTGRRSLPKIVGAWVVVALAVLLLAPTLQNMYQVTYMHAADAPHEMMIYVQTTTDINIVMQKIDALDQQLYGGKHQLGIGVKSDATWPFAWYLRDYKNVCYSYPDASCPFMPQAVVVGGDDIPGSIVRFQKDYNFHQYHMRSQWDQGYMPTPCKITATNKCTDPQPYTGVGPWRWLSYGDNPPTGKDFDLGRAVSNIWQWWWQRKAFGDTTGAYDMGLFIRKGTGVNP